ncbi:MAG TPA: UDP-N-acetylglucosamine 2-epimerase (non-hydrolyzing) [Burkholderiales bacterium]|nr:UDP-N-acetylglucosamine 2-epimerase (non-hydrolyzing) [Burkholderiales bacterium]
MSQAQHGPIICVVGARPNYMKMAPILAAFAKQVGLPKTVLVHTGQHYDVAMNDKLFGDLGMPQPDLNLEVGSGTHAVQTAEIMRRFEAAVDDLKPSCVLVVGDVNSTLACSLVATKKGIAVIHVEAGLRSYDRGMPEEINRVLTDQMADLLYTTERSAHANLAREGIDINRAQFVGNVMIDSLMANKAHAVPPEQSIKEAGGDPAFIAQGYGLVTLHRPSNVDDPQMLSYLFNTLAEVSRSLPLVCALHPRTRGNIEKFGLGGLLKDARMLVLPPFGYLEMLGLMARASAVLTDSGGLQEETTALAVPCLTIRQNTERPITIEQGTNTLVGCDRDTILAAVKDILATGGKRGRSPEYWDGHAAERIAQHLAQWFAQQRKLADAA